MKTSSSEKTVLKWAAGVLGFFILLPILVVGIYFQVRFGAIPFSSAEWKAAPEGRSQTRVKMMEDLLRAHPLVGMTRREAGELLGVPAAANSDPECEWRYWLGHRRAVMSNDSEWLCLKFQGDRVDAAVVRRD